MTSVLQLPRFHSYAPRSPTGGGILLNPSPYTQPPSLPQASYPSRSNQSLSPSTSSSEDVNTPSSSVRATPPTSLSNSLFLPYTSDEDHVLRSRRSSAPEYGASGSRRIRFAPLPDPRRSVLVTEHGEELPLPSVFDDDDPSGTPGPSLRNFPTSHPPSLLLGDSVVTSKELTNTITPDPSSSRVQSVRHSVSSPSSPSYPRATESPTPSTATVTGASSILAKRWFYPFRQKSGDSRRPSSRDSSSSRDDTPSRGLTLGLSTSSDDGSRSTSKGGAPLFRVRSAQPKPKPKRMLNGRVYGARKHHTQPTDVFQNIPDEEPEFVEWGHGGMGSVSAGGMWGKVQSSQKLLIGHTEERGRPGAPQADDEDDGSGMGWVKKRREERERKKREEQAAQEAANNANADPLPTLVSPPVPVPPTAHDSPLVCIDHDISTVMPAQPSPEEDDESSDEDDEEVDDESSSSGTDQEDDGANQEQHFKQVLGAGVERVSRHRD